MMVKDSVQYYNRLFLFADHSQRFYIEGVRLERLYQTAVGAYRIYMSKGREERWKKSTDGCTTREAPQDHGRGRRSRYGRGGTRDGRQVDG